LAESLEQRFAVVVRVATPGHPAFQLRKGEEGLSVFDPDAVDPALGEDEILEAFRPGSIVVYRTKSRIEELGLVIAEVDGGDALPTRLRSAHCEIRQGGMERLQFKHALRELEE
jgi:hypothetical protein